MTKPRKKQAASRVQRAAVFQPEFREDLCYWVETDRKIALRAFDLIEAIMRDPFNGIGKPEPLKHLAPGAWSRRLTEGDGPMLKHRAKSARAVNRSHAPVQPA